MGLSDIPSLPERPNLRVDISRFAGKGAFVEFREPGLPDYMTDGKAARRLQIDNPDFSDTLIRQILLLARCHIRQPGDPKDLEPSLTLARIAARNMGAWLHILNAFSEAYPEDFDGQVEQAKNDSAE